jgi:Transglutaminase-like superfamily
LSTLPSRLRALSELRGAGEVLLLVRLGAFAAAVPLLMRLPLPRLAVLLTRAPRRPPPSAAEIERFERLIALAPQVARPLVRPGCLTRGVTLFWFLRRAGLDVELRFGLDPGDEQATDGHCWLSLDGQPFLEKVDPRSRFAELYRLPLAAG